MGWFTYYSLLEKYSGDFNKATQEEKDYAARSNPNNPHDALVLAQKKWDEEQRDNGLCYE